MLFGSYARGTENVESDIDIAFKTDQKVSSQEKFDLVQELEEIVKKDIDLVKIDMFREYLELNESRKEIIKRVKNGGTIYGK